MCYETDGLNLLKGPKICKRMIHNAIIGGESQSMTANSISLVILLLAGVGFLRFYQNFLK